MSPDSLGRVLVIDDDPDIREPVASALSEAGYDVSVARDGWMGLEAQRAKPADLVITDIFMPERDGFETIGQFKREFPNTPIIAMSGKEPFGLPGARIDYLTAARRFGATRILRKPFGIEELLTAVHDLMASCGADASDASRPDSRV